jgi:YegS/Rv2252/BmrU family lipid kinase
VRCVLIHNPVSGVARDNREQQLRDVVDALLALGHQAELISTTGPRSATAQTRQAVENGAEVVFACGGDGTIHEVVQGLVCEGDEPKAALGIIPLGSANALARHLHLPLNPRQAALQQIRGEARTVPLGKLKFNGQVRYFTVMAGTGPDGALVYSLLTANKSRLGRFAYYLRAARLYATTRFRPFEIEYVEAGSAEAVTQRAVSAMAVRVDDLGGLFSRLAGRGGSIDEGHLRLLILRPPALISLPLWFVSGWAGLLRFNPFFRSVKVTRFCCNPHSGTAAHVQVDGEWIGRVPVEVSVVPLAVKVFAPLPGS